MNTSSKLCNKLNCICSFRRSIRTRKGRTNLLQHISLQSVCLFVSLYLYASLPGFLLSYCLLFCLSVCPFYRLSVSSVFLSFRLFICLFLSSSGGLPVCLSFCLSFCLFFLSFCLSVCLFVCLS